VPSNRARVYARAAYRVGYADSSGRPSASPFSTISRFSSPIELRVSYPDLLNRRSSSLHSRFDARLVQLVVRPYVQLERSST
jgi:hypothetical protein